MILFLDPGDFLLGLYLQDKPLNDQAAFRALKSIYNELLTTPDDILSLIDGIIFINSSGYLKEISEKVYASFLNSIKKQSKKTKDIFSLLQLPLFENFTHDEVQFNLMAYIRSHLKNTEALFIDSLLTNSTIKFLMSFSKVTGFRKLNENSLSKWEEIERVDQYLKIVQALHYKFVGLELIKNNYKKSQASQKDIVLKDLKFYKNVHKFNRHAFRFNTNENEEIEDFLDRLKEIVGYFKYHYCSIDGINPSLEDERLIIMGIENLEENERLKLLKRISEDDYNDRLIIIILKNGIDIDDFPKIRLRVDFSDGTAKEIFDHSLGNIQRKIKVFDDKIEEYRSVITKLKPNEKEKNGLLKKLNKYSTGDNLFSTEKVNFWYEIVSLEFSDDREETINEREKIYKGTKRVTHYKIDLNLENNIWIIEKDGVGLKPINFDRYKAIKYLVYLYENYSDGKKISFNKLEEVSRNWGKTNKVKNIKTNYSTVSDNKRRLLKKYSEFEPIREFLRLSSKESGCYYIKNDKVIIELGNFPIPDVE